jgi:hypothetical protein
MTSERAKSPAETVIEKLGGLTKLARSLNCAVSTVQGWKDRGKIPQEHWLAIIEVAKSQDIDITFEDFVLKRAA